MAMQPQLLLPPAPDATGVRAHLAAFDHARLVSRLADSGFDLVELGGDLVLFFPDSYAPAAVERLDALRHERDLTYTVHLPLWSVDPSTPLGPVRQGSVRALVDTVLATLALEPEVYVLHPVGALATEFYRMRTLTEGVRPALLRLFQDLARSSVRAILAETGITGRRLAIETVEFPFDLTLELAEELDVSMCLDTGHVLAGFAGDVELFDALERCLPRLAEIHLHDAPWQGPERSIGYGRDHQVLGAGDLDVARLLDRLEAAGFAGPVVFELGVDEALASLALVR